MGSFIQQFYEQTTHIPADPLVSTVFDGMDVIQEWLDRLKKAQGRYHLATKRTQAASDSHGRTELRK